MGGNAGRSGTRATGVPLSSCLDNVYRHDRLYGLRSEGCPVPVCHVSVPAGLEVRPKPLLNSAGVSPSRAHDPLVTTWASACAAGWVWPAEGQQHMAVRHCATSWTWGMVGDAEPAAEPRSPSSAAVFRQSSGRPSVPNAGLCSCTGSKRLALRSTAGAVVCSGGRGRARMAENGGDSAGKQRRRRQAKHRRGGSTEAAGQQLAELAAKHGGGRCRSRTRRRFSGCRRRMPPR